MKKPKYIFVVGGVMSGVGKGIAAASLGTVLKSKGLQVTSIKIDPYVNVDAGTMNPTEHGEVFVLDDGMECDQDMGNYERFLNQDLSRANYMTTGSVYQTVIQRERNLGYGGKFVSVVPYIPLEVIDRINGAIKKNKADIGIIEIGGTVGEYENILFLEAVRMLQQRHRKDVVVVLVSLVPALGAGGNELKTKPTQHAVRSMNNAGIHPDIILCRAHVPLDEERKAKLEFTCNLEKGDVLSAPNVESIYDVPVNFDAEDVGGKVLKKLGLRPRRQDLKEWRSFVSRIQGATDEVRIGIAGKYFGTGDFVLTDSYISIIEAIRHAGAAMRKKPVIDWIDAERYEKDPSLLKELSGYDGIVIPGGFGSRGVEGKIKAIEYIRTKKIPYLGLCYGMQLAVVEYARHKMGWTDANTAEIDQGTSHPVIDILPEQRKNLKEKNYGATMRLGGYPAIVKKGTHAGRAYQTEEIRERHRHRYEVNPEYIEALEKGGLVFSGVSPDRRLMEITELKEKDHPFFVGTQFHPELTSRPLRPHPLFVAFLKAAAKKK